MGDLALVVWFVAFNGKKLSLCVFVVDLLVFVVLETVIAETVS